MAEDIKTLLSVVVPLYNEAGGLKSFHKILLREVKAAAGDSYEIIYCDDGSSDDTAKIVRELHSQNPKVKLIKFSRNFGKENALSAGIGKAEGQVIMMLDGDGQHPVELIPQFIKPWKEPSTVASAVRTRAPSHDW